MSYCRCNHNIFDFFSKDVQQENSDELGHLFDTIMKTGQKLKNELQVSIRSLDC